MGIERVNGEPFTSVEPTPQLAACIAAAHEALVAVLGERGAVAAGRSWRFAQGTELTPSLLVTVGSTAEGGSAVPALVVEFRTESTGRYVLGPKRMVYSRHRVPEFWYVDPLNRRVAVMRSHDGEEYRWPPEELGPDELLMPQPFPGVTLPARALMGPAFEGDLRAGRVEGEAWLAA